MTSAGKFTSSSILEEELAKREVVSSVTSLRCRDFREKNPTIFFPIWRPRSGSFFFISRVSYTRGIRLHLEHDGRVGYTLRKRVPVTRP